MKFASKRNYSSEKKSTTLLRLCYPLNRDVALRMYLWFASFFHSCVYCPHRMSFPTSPLHFIAENLALRPTHLDNPLLSDNKPPPVRHN